MDKPLLIKDVTALAAFEPAIKLQAISADLRNPYFRDYILTEDLASMYARMLTSALGAEWGATASSLPGEQRRSHLIAAQYGTGKSYFLTVLAALLGAAGDTHRLQTAKSKFAAFRQVQNLLSQLSDKKFLVILISAEDKGDVRFKELLVHTLLDRVSEVLPDAVFSNEYTEAIGHLREIETSPVGLVFTQVLETQFDTSLQQLRAKLDNYDRTGLHTYYQACERALGRKVSRDVLDMETTFRDALDLLAPKGYTHIVVLIDELTAYLKASAGHHPLAETLGELQSFAAFCNKSSSRCLFVAAMHEALQTFLKERFMEKDYEKAKGRFHEHSFPFYSPRLLAGIFKPKDNFDQAVRGHRHQVEELTELITTFKMYDDGAPMRLSAFFPLHPAVAHYLPRISRVLGQAERTTFGFIDEVVRRKLDEPLTREGQLNLVTLDQVFDYFLPAMEQRDPYLQVIAAYNAVQSKVANPVAQRAFKPLALLWIASRALSDEAQYLETDLTLAQTADFIGAKDHLSVAEALDTLCKLGFVYFDGSMQKYCYVSGDVGPNLDVKIQENMSAVDPDEVLRSELLALGSRVSLNVPPTVLVKVDRTIESQSIDKSQLEETASIKPRRAEAKIVFVVPSFADMESYNSLFSEVTQKARALSASNVVVAVPKKVGMLNPMELMRYRALQEIGRQLETDKPGTATDLRSRMTRSRLGDVEPRVQSDIAEFGQASNFIFFVNRQPQEAQDLTTILVDMFERYYYKFPKVKVERINGRSTTNALIENCIVNPQTTFTGDTSEVARHARDTLQVLGFCSWRQAAGGKYVVELKAPDSHSEADEIWQIVLDTLTKASAPFATLYERLGQQPYGLPDFLVELYIAAAIALRKVYVLDKDGRMPTASKGFVADITRRKDNDYRVLPAQKTEVPYTFVCSVWQAIDEPLGLRHYQELEKNLGRPIDDQRTWMAVKADAKNLLQNRLSRVTENLQAIEAESAPFTSLVNRLGQLKPILGATQGFEQLGALGEELSHVKLSQDPDAGAQAIREVIDASEEFMGDWEGLEHAYQRHKHLVQAGNLDRWTDLARSAHQAWQAYRTDALSKTRRKTFLEQFERLWREYAHQYVDEHNAVTKARANYGKKLQQSLAYQLIGDLSQLGFQGITTRSTIDARIKDIRQQACDPLPEDSMRDYRKFSAVICSCGYRLGTDVQILTQLQKSEDSLFANINNALDSYVAKLAESLCSESIRLYAKEKASAEEQATIGSVQNLVGKGRAISEVEYKKLQALLPGLRSLSSKASDYARQEAAKRQELQRQLDEEERQRHVPRLPKTQLSDLVRDFLLESGLDTMTYTELEHLVKRWLQQVAKQFKHQG